MEELRTYLNQYFKINESEWNLLQAIIQNQKFDTKQLLVQSGQVSKYIYFIRSGLLRVFHLNKGKEISTYFACDGQFISTFESLITQKPSTEYLETIEATEVYAISYKKLIDLYEQNPKFEKIGRMLAEQNYLCIKNRTYNFQTQTAKERYLEFINTYHQKIIQRVPQKQLASYLGIEAESLSRIRGQFLIT
ncbi:Crp/Fnr family transcriptional regulator (plasmid) [Bernardetia sp. Wsw4-3y2]|uniref:Crp/Fnr family transcriptional regulator n=1 Tax=unclassified Bernardetia TaxID=2647129 RepID=UPI0030D5CF57